MNDPSGHRIDSPIAADNWTNAVDAIFVDESPVACVVTTVGLGSVGVPRNVGDVMFAFNASAVSTYAVVAGFVLLSPALCVVAIVVELSVVVPVNVVGPAIFGIVAVPVKTVGPAMFGMVAVPV
jgi:hypothetical protein